MESITASNSTKTKVEALMVYLEIVSFSSHPAFIIGFKNLIWLLCASKSLNQHQNTPIVKQKVMTILYFNALKPEMTFLRRGFIHDIGPGEFYCLTQNNRLTAFQYKVSINKDGRSLSVRNYQITQPYQMEIRLDDSKENPDAYKNRTHYYGTFSCVCLDNDQKINAKFKGIRQNPTIFNEAVNFIRKEGIEAYNHNQPKILMYGC